MLFFLSFCSPHPSEVSLRGKRGCGYLVGTRLNQGLVPLFCFVEKQKRGTSPWLTHTVVRSPHPRSARRLAPLGVGYKRREKRAKKTVESFLILF